METDEDLIKKEILRSFLKTEKLEKQRKDIVEDVWPRIKGRVAITEGSFKSVILNRRLEDLQNVDQLIVKNSQVAKNVRWKIPNADAEEKAKIIVFGNPVGLKEALKEFLEFEAREEGEKESLIKIFHEWLLPSMMILFWAKICKAVVDKNQSDIAFYVKRGKERISSLFETVAEMLQMEEFSEEVESIKHSWDLALEEMKGKRGFVVWQAPESDEFFTEWLKQKTKGVKEWKSLPHKVKEQYLRREWEELIQTEEKKLIPETTSLDIKKSLPLMLEKFDRLLTKYYEPEKALEILEKVKFEIKQGKDLGIFWDEYKRLMMQEAIEQVLGKSSLADESSGVFK